MLVIILAAFAGYILGGFSYATACAICALLCLMIRGTMLELYFTHKYKHEYMACTEAILANDELMVDEVNRWTTHFYVKKAFYASHNDPVSVGYLYSINSYKREPSYGGGDGSIVV